jgi:hypothetical protein
MGELNRDCFCRQDKRFDEEWQAQNVMLKASFLFQAQCKFSKRFLQDDIALHPQLS